MWTTSAVVAISACVRASPYLKPPIVRLSRFVRRICTTKDRTVSTWRVLVLARRSRHVTTRWKSRLPSLSRRGETVLRLRGLFVGVRWRWPRCQRGELSQTNRRVCPRLSTRTTKDKNGKKIEKYKFKGDLRENMRLCFSLELENKRRCLPIVWKYVR